MGEMSQTVETNAGDRKLPETWAALRIGEGVAALVWLGLAVVAMNHPWWWVCLLACALTVACIRIGHVRRSMVIEAYAFVFLSCAAVVAVGGMRGVELWMAIGAGGFLAMAATLPLAGRSGRAERSTETADISARLMNLESAVHQVRDFTAMSDAAKRIVNQDRELELIRGAIGEAIARGDHAHALRLCDGIEFEMKQPEEAQVIRQHVQAVREPGEHTHVVSEIQQLDEILQRHDWGQAYQHAARVRQLNQDPQLSMEMEQRILQARTAYGRDLQQRFMDAAHRNDLSQAMAHLKELDRYMTREEAASIAGMAQDVVVRYRESLGMQFKLAVSERRWKEAVIVGDQIALEFPNTKMADEVRHMIVVLRQRAHDVEPAPAGSGSR